MLTPEAFKLALQRAKKTDTQTIDPKVYARYFQFLEKVVKYYSKYQIAKLNATKGHLENTLTNIAYALTGIVETNNRLEKHAEANEKRAEAADKKADAAAFNLEEIKKTVGNVVEMLQEKSILSTMNPVNPDHIHHFVCMGYKFTCTDTGKDGWVLTFTSGQDAHVSNVMRKKYKDTDHNWTVQIDKHYNANGVDLRNNIKTTVDTHVKEFITSTNAKRVAKADRQNRKLKKRIEAHNKKHPDEKRVFKDEKIKVVKIKRSDIPISCQKLTARYIENDIMSYDEFLELIKSVNEETQKSPFQSETSDADSTTADDN